MKGLLPALLALAVASLALPSAAEGVSYETMVVMVERMADIVDMDKADCTKMGADLTIFFDANAGTFRELEAWGKRLTAEQKKEWAAKFKPRLGAATQKMMAGMQKCGNTQSVKDAYAKFPLLR